MASATSRSTAKPRRRRRLLPRKLRIFLAVTWGLLAVAFIGGSLLAWPRLQKAAAIVPQIEDMMVELKQSPSTVWSADGKLLYSIQPEYRRSISRRDIPNKVVNAVLAAEDKRFLEHSGVDPLSIGRIVVLAAKEGKASQGGSTLTMQLAKRLFTGDARTLDRKLDNMALAIMIEQKLTKDQILELYCNESYFGERAYGIVAAADVYYGKTLEQLTIGEAATLARCVRRPSDENPVRDPEAAKANRNIVLATMLEESMISQQEYDKALAEPIKTRAQRPRVLTHEKVAPFFVDYILAELKAKNIDISAGGVKVVTTLDTRAQDIADSGVRKWVRNFRGYRVNQMAFLCTDSSGRIMAMVGGPDYDKSQFNMMWMKPGRQPGSSFKPFVYATGLELGTFASSSSISTKAMKKPGTNEYFKGGANRGYISIATALSTSNNTAAVRAMDDVGSANVVRFCRRNFGFHQSNLPEVISLALGSGEVSMLELASGYSVFQSHGDRSTAYGVEYVIMPDGSEVSLKPDKAKAVISSDSADYIDGCLRRVVTGGTARAAGGVTNARGKTGTTSDSKDVWFCGYTDKFIGIVWMGREETVNGRPKSVPMRGLMGGHGPAPAWNDIVGDIQRLIGEKSRSFGSLPHVRNDPPGDVDDIPLQRDEPEPTVPEQPGDEIDPGVVTDPNGDGPRNHDTGTGTTGDTGNLPPVKNDPPRQPVRGGTSGGGGGGTTDNRDVVYISVCADSGMRATGYCPEVVKRPFFKGTEPRGRCSLHGR